MLQVETWGVIHTQGCYSTYSRASGSFFVNGDGRTTKMRGTLPPPWLRIPPRPPLPFSQQGAG